MKFRLTSPYGALEEFRDHPHKGVDLALPQHTELRSIFDGYVEKIVDYGDSNLGKAVYVKFKNGTTGIYGHMSDNTSVVYEGKIVKTGDLIGYSGNTGESTGAHLHFQLLDKHGEVIDPTSLIERVSDMQGKGQGGGFSLKEWILNRGAVDNYEKADYNMWHDLGAYIATDMKEGFIHLIKDGIELLTYYMPTIGAVGVMLIGGYIMVTGNLGKGLIWSGLTIAGSALWLANASS